MLQTINGFHTFVNDDKKILFDIPLKKREGVEHSLCFFVAAQNIRRPSVSPDFEAKLQNLLEKQKIHEQSLTSVNSLLLSWDNANLREYDKLKCSQIMQNQLLFLKSVQVRQQALLNAQKRGEQLDEKNLLEETPRIIEILVKFLKQDQFDNLFDYLSEIKFRQRNTLQLLFMNSIGHSNAKIAQNFCDSNPSMSKELLENPDAIGKLPVHQCGPHLQKCVQLLAAHHYQIISSRWKPSDSFDVFFNLLKTEGPVCVNGNLGQYIYKKPPHYLNESCGKRPVYGWKPGTPKAINLHFQHIVTVICAVRHPDKLDFGFVYYLDPALDPADPCDPENPTLEKVLKVSYKSLQEGAQLYGSVQESAGAPLSDIFAWRRA